MLTIWKASAINARDPTHNPTPNSRTKNAVSIPSIIEMRVDFDHAILKNRRRGVVVVQKDGIVWCCFEGKGQTPLLNCLPMRLMKLAFRFVRSVADTMRVGRRMIMILI